MVRGVWGWNWEAAFLEITETVMMTNQEQRMETLESLRKNGFIIEMDDFAAAILP